MTLTEKQKSLFDVFGFLNFSGLFAREAEAITQAFEAVWAEHGGGHNGHPHDDQQNSALLPFIDQHPYLCALLDDERVEAIGAGLLGEDFNYMSSDGNYFVGDTVWHSDGYQRAPGYCSIKLAFYLDAVGYESGCLRVIPGSHKSNFLNPELSSSHIKARGGAVDGATGAIEVHMKAGDALLFVDTISHGSKRITTGIRRTIVYRYGPSWGFFRHGYRPSKGLLDRLTPDRRKIVWPHHKTENSPYLI